MTVQLDEFKTRQRAVWSAGDYDLLSARIAEVGELVVERAAVDSGTSVLDVACGTGNVSIPAARAGAQVTGLDLTPKLLEQARAKSEAAGLEIQWVEGDAEDLPFEDDSFERVVSTFGHMFAPRHRRVADEMIRVCRGGGRIVTATWAPEGTVGDTIRAGASFMPPPPEYASPPLLWGTEDHVREMFVGAAKGFEFERHVNWIEADSLEEFSDFFLDNFPTTVTAKAMLGERFAELREQMISIWRDANEADDGRFRLPQEYLLSIVPT
jgi:SAM-dependent methyltransferase